MQLISSRFIWGSLSLCFSRNVQLQYVPPVADVKKDNFLDIKVKLLDRFITPIDCSTPKSRIENNNEPSL